MKKILLITFMFVTALVTQSWAQDQVISGKVTSAEDGSALPGVNVILKGTSTGTATDIDGNYKFSAPANGTLVFSFIGLTSKEVAIGNQSIINVAMSADAKQLSEVVVTALGVKRDEKALGYSVQQVNSDAIVNSGATSAVDALVGKAAGIQVTRSSGSAGGGSRILIRGTTSLVGNNQPLVVIDGVRTNNDTQVSEGKTNGTASSNRLMDLNTDDIESVSILKGAAATALYGTAGSTGVIIITTKKGTKKDKIAVNFSTQVAVDQITNTIKLQDKYSQGWGGAYDDPSTGSSTSWGPKVSDLEYSTDAGHADAPGAGAFDAEGNYRFDKNGFLVPKGTGNGQAANVYDNVNPFFEKSVSTTNSVSVSGGGDVATFRFSASNHDGSGIVPNEEYKRKTFKLASDLRVSEKLNFSGSINYTRSDYQRIQQGSNTSGLLLGMYRTPVTFDNTNGLDPSKAVNDPSAYVFADGRQRNYRGGGGYDNPYWIVNNALRNEGVDRMFGNVKIDYKFSDWANLSLNIGTDMTSDVRQQHFEINSRTQPSGGITHDEFNTRQTDVNLLLNGSGQLNEDFAMNYLVGMNMFSYNMHNAFSQGADLAFPGFVHMSNAATVTAGENNARNRTIGFFAQGEASWRNTIFLTLAARTDYDSRLGNPSDFELSNTNFTYPSASLAFIFTELMNNTGPLSFGKIRASWAKVGAGPPNPYTTQSVFVSPTIGDGWGTAIGFPIGGVSGFDQSSLLGNPELTPEFTTSTEFGLDLRFFEGRLGLDVAYYNRKTVDAILNASLPLSTGYANVWLNAGEMTSDGIEITLNAVPVKTADFRWDSQVNFTKSKSVVDKLAPGIDKLQLAGFSSAGTYLVAGNEYGAIFGGAYLREGSGGANDDGVNIPEGAVVINDDPTSSEYGFEAVDPTQRAIGNPNPDFIVGWNNTLKYKNFSLGFLFDWREGGDLWNGTAWALSFFGRSQLTADTREEAPFVIDGVLSDGTPNNIEIVRDQSYWTSSLGGFGSVGEQFVQDGGWVRLRELSLKYSLPQSLFGQNFIKGGSIGVTGRNLWLSTDYDGIDPETSLTGSGNGQGFDYFNMPATKSLIFKLSLDF